jgi:CRP/FNR family cyclic AMP-dependent transcriptional regulator
MANDEALDMLRSVDLFHGLDDRQLRGIASRGHIHDHAAGHVVTEQGGEAVGFHLILAGSAEVHVDGKAVRTLKPGSYFGEISLIDGKPRSASIVAGDGLQTFGLTSWEFRPILEEQPPVALTLLTALCSRLRDAEGRGAH